MPISRIKIFSPTLFNYLCKRFFMTVLATTILLGAFIYLVDVIEMLRMLSTHNHINSSLAFLMALYKLPYIILQVAPFILLLGTLISFTRLNRDRELIAVRGSGLPARHFLLPALFVCFLIGIFNLFVTTPLSSALLKKYEQTEHSLFPSNAHGVITNSGQIWLRQPEEKGDLFIYAKDVQKSGNLLKNVTIFHFAEDGSFMQRQDAEEMIRYPFHWQLKRVFVLSPWKEVTWHAEEQLETQLTPEVIADSLSSPETLTLWQLQDFITRFKDAELPTQKHELYYHRLLASPALLIAMFLLAAPFALRFSRTHSLGQVLLVGLLTGVAFYLFTNVVVAYGLTGRLPPYIAAWAPTAVAGLIGTGLFLHFKEE